MHSIFDSNKIFQFLWNRSLLDGVSDLVLQNITYQMSILSWNHISPISQIQNMTCLIGRHETF